MPTFADSGGYCGIVYYLILIFLVIRLLWVVTGSNLFNYNFLTWIKHLINLP